MLINVTSPQQSPQSNFDTFIAPDPRYNLKSPTFHAQFDFQNTSPSPDDFQELFITSYNKYDEELNELMELENLLKTAKMDMNTSFNSDEDDSKTTNCSNIYKKTIGSDVDKITLSNSVQLSPHLPNKKNYNLNSVTIDLMHNKSIKGSSNQVNNFYKKRSDSNKSDNNPRNKLKNK